jgi:hypothetical protein
MGDATSNAYKEMAEETLERKRSLLHNNIIPLARRMTVLEQEIADHDASIKGKRDELRKIQQTILAHIMYGTQKKTPPPKSLERRAAKL